MNYDVSLDYEIIHQTKMGICPLHNLEIFTLYKVACKYAFLYINKMRYKNLVDVFSKSEVDSFVYFVLIYCIKTYRTSNEQKISSFKNYFYLLIRYKAINELKNHYEKNIVTNWKRLIREKNNYVVFSIHESQNNNEIESKIKIILAFLKTKNPHYADLVKDKLNGLSNKAIAHKNNSTEEKIKAKFQYIKKIVLSKFKTLEQVE